MKYKFNHNSWYGHTPVEIEIPDSWQISECRMLADDMRSLTRDEIKAKIDSPYGSQTIKDLAKGKKDVCIIFDDMSRGTPCDVITDIILEELLDAGIPKDHIRFICALGSHGTCTREDFAKKLGDNVVKEYAVFNHNTFQNCEYVGTTSGGVELYINSEVMKCDLKIGIGSISPHPVNGYGGGGKLLMIGCAGIKTIDMLHKASQKCVIENKLAFQECLGSLKLDGMRKEIEEGVRLTGFDFKIDAILNSDCAIVDLTAGDPVEEYYQGVEISSKVNFCDSKPQGMDVVIANANVKANEAAIAFGVSRSLLKDEGGAMVMIDHIPTGQVVHQYGGAAGYFIGGMDFRGIMDRFPTVDKVILYSPYPDVQSAISFGDNKRITFAETWDEVLAILKDYGADTKAALISDATIMAFR